jgi:MFS family permease
MSNVISVTGSGFSSVAFPFAVLRIGGSASDLGYVATAALVPLIACLLLGGVVGDRLPRYRVIAGANTVQAAVQGTAALLLLTGQARVWELIVLAALGGLAFGFYLPAASGLLPQTVSPAERPRANAIDRAGMNAATICGAALGGLVAGTAGPGWGLAADALSFAVAGALRTGVRFPSPGTSGEVLAGSSQSGFSQSQAGPAARRTRMIADLADGWREFTSRRWLWTSVVQFSVVCAVSAALTEVLGPLVAHTSLGGASAWGLTVAVFAIGAVGGSLAMARFRPRRILAAAMLAVPPFALLLFALAVPFPLPVVLITAAIAGISVEAYTVNWTTALQQEIPPGAMSRVSSYNSLGRYALNPVGIMVAGPLVAAFGPRTVLAGGGLLVIVLPFVVLLSPDVRHMRRAA